MNCYFCNQELCSIELYYYPKDLKCTHCANTPEYSFNTSGDFNCIWFHFNYHNKMFEACWFPDKFVLAQQMGSGVWPVVCEISIDNFHIITPNNLISKMPSMLTFN